MKNLGTILYSLKTDVLSSMFLKVLVVKLILVIGFLTLMILGICSDSQTARAQDWLESGFFDGLTALEYHFDGGEGPENPIRDSGGSRHEAVLMNGAHRTSITEGILYGRALELDGVNDYVSVDNNRTYIDKQLFTNGFAFKTWLYPTDITGIRTIISKEDVFRLALCSGYPCIFIKTANGAMYTKMSTLYFPANEKNYLEVIFDRYDLTFRKNGELGGKQVMNFSTTGTTIQHLINSFPVIIGSYAGRQDFFAGKIDDLLWYKTGILDCNNLDKRDGNPSVCISGYQCAVESIIAVPDGWDKPEPVRISTGLNSNLCGTPNKCRLLIMIAGGGRCSDGFYKASKMKQFADEGYIVSSIHPHCENNEAWAFYPQETSLIVKAIEYLLTSSLFTDRIDKNLGYYALGGSHGAVNVAILVFKEDILPPERAWALSGIYDAHDDYHNNPEITQLFRDHFDRWVGSFYGPHTDVDYLARFLDNSVIVFDDPAELERFSNIVSDREFAASWGVNLNGGQCDEEEEGFTYSGRKLRDLWLTTNPLTGYFLENNSTDCQHGFNGPVDFTQGWTCIKQFFRCGPQCMPTDWRNCQ